MIKVWTKGYCIGIEHSDGVVVFDSIDDAIKFGDDLASIAMVIRDEACRRFWKRKGRLRSANITRGIKEATCPECGTMLDWSRPTLTREYPPDENRIAEDIPGPVAYESCSACGYRREKFVGVQKAVQPVCPMEMRMDEDNCSRCPIHRTCEHSMYNP